MLGDARRGDGVADKDGCEIECNNPDGYDVSGKITHVSAMAL